MGWRYVRFRIAHEWRRRSGIMQSRFPVNPPPVSAPSLAWWKEETRAWLWPAKAEMQITKRPTSALKQSAEGILNGKILLFNSIPYHIDNQNDWVTHPITGFRYDVSKHWTRIPDLSPEAGDIKFVWERSRFGHIQSILRYDYHFDLDHSEWVLNEMDSWIAANPINCGPNYRCSQEISLRVFNWLGALSFYRNSPALTPARWDQYIYHMYWQIHHVRHNIDFSRIAVRNNHAVTETLALYIFGTLFPGLPGTGEWRLKGRAWFEEEIAYQIYPDGTFLQFSMNYHRVLIQLLTLGIRFAEIRGEKFAQTVYERAGASLYFLRTAQDPVSGQLPNYGANDGALFFQFTDKPYRVYTDQLNALGAALYRTVIFDISDSETSDWFGYTRQSYLQQSEDLPEDGQVFADGGYAIVKERDTLTFLRSGKHKDRPSQADNLHLDLWYRGENLFRDSGSYKYNADEADIRYFFGTRSHNTLMVSKEDQMLKGPRFIWLHWSQALQIAVHENPDDWVVEGKVQAFKQLSKRLIHHRRVTKIRNQPVWKIEDEVAGWQGELVEVLWHPSPFALAHFEIEAELPNGDLLPALVEEGWYSGLYGVKEPSPVLVFGFRAAKLTTTIRPKNTMFAAHL